MALVWHRRAGKDDVALHWAATQALTRPGSYWHMLPEYAQGRKAIWQAVKVAERDRAQVSLGQIRLSASHQASDPALSWEANTIQAAVHDLVARLPKRLQQVITARYGLNGHQARIYRRIGARLGLSRERARQLHTEALVWLRHPAHSQSLRSLLNRHQVADYQTAHQQAHQWLRRRGGRNGC